MADLDKLRISKFDIKSIMSDATILLLGRRRSGKSFLCRDILYNHRHIPAGVVFSGTEAVSPFFSDFIPDSFIHTEYKPELINSMMDRQKRKIRETKESGQSTDGKTAKNNRFIILDDLQHDAQTWKKDKTIKSIFFNGRHFNYLFILTLQYLMGITPELRSNLDYVFLFHESSIKNRRKIFEDYCSVIPSFEYFCNIMDVCTSDHKCLVIKTNGEGFENSVFWYKAKERKNFKIGGSTVWKYHNRKYNKNYAQDGDGDNKFRDEYKKKFGHAKKLKVMVSREGDVIGHKVV
ncbi:MAG: ATPase/DNA packaging protein [Candidatus Shapirobacteria bacterium]|nr:ATPase/DNA packaging protein [Candidatus Shapirobacteria bacterium]